MYRIKNHLALRHGGWYQLCWRAWKKYADRKRHRRRSVTVAHPEKHQANDAAAAVDEQSELVVQETRDAIIIASEEPPPPRLRKRQAWSEQAEDARRAKILLERKRERNAVRILEQRQSEETRKRVADRLTRRQASKIATYFPHIRILELATNTWHSLLDRYSSKLLCVEFFLCQRRTREPAVSVDP